jgi:hypothetical protein
MAKEKYEMRDIIINDRFVRHAKVKICHICGGHMPVTKKVALGECVGHLGLRSHLEPL